MTINYDEFNDTVIISITGNEANLVIPDKVIKICSNSTKDQTGITGISFAEGSKLNELEDYAFAFSSLTSISLKNCKELESLPKWCFRTSSLKQIELPENGKLREIHEGCFALNSIETIIIPQTVEYFYDCNGFDQAVFHVCSKLTTVIFSGNSRCSHLGTKMFWSCTSLLSLSIPPLVRELPQMLFYSCSSLQTLHVLSNELTYIDVEMFSNSSTPFIYVLTPVIKKKFIENNVSKDNIMMLRNKITCQTRSKMQSLRVLCFYIMLN